MRTLRQGEWAAWRRLRLRALADAPDSFESLLEDERDQPDSWWEDLIESTIDHPRGSLWFVEGAEGPVGMAFARIDPALVTVEIGAMWVDPLHRGRGLGRLLLATAIRWGRAAGAETATLWVTEGNDAAERLYRGAGFTTQTDRQPLRPGSSVHGLRLTADLDP